VDYGWLTVVATPIFWTLTFIQGIVQNWGGDHPAYRVD
jgi:YidC/Oxa1 family membrane protein insertase